MKIKDILNVTGGRLLSGRPGYDLDLSTISTDTRTLEKGSFFLPLEGANFDAERFIEEAFKKGAIGTFTRRSGTVRFAASRDNIVIQVKDTLDALQKMARYHRSRLKTPVVAVTGSNGKTSVKEMIAAVLAAKYNVLKNEGTKNNHIGMPLTLLKLNRGHDVCVLELGANHAGEIASLARIAAPQTAVITNIGHSHLEFFKNLEGVFKAKKELLKFLEKDGLAVLNGDDKYLCSVRSSRFRIKRFGFSAACDPRTCQLSIEKGRIGFELKNAGRFTLNLVGVHNVYNALAAIAVGRSFAVGYDAMKKALARYVPADKRLNLIKIRSVTVMDDTYNSNPLSMMCALDSLKRYPANARWVVSADMLELGKERNKLHAAVGEIIARSGFDGLLTFGRLSKNTYLRAIECGMSKGRVWHCSTRGEIARILRGLAGKDDAVLIKGSRSMRMEEVVKELGEA